MSYKVASKKVRLLGSKVPTNICNTAFDAESLKRPQIYTGSKIFDYQFLATLDKRGQGIPNEGNKKGGGRKGYQCDLNYNLIER